MSGVRHRKTSTVPDGLDPAEVQPSDWNADHDVSIGVADIDATGTPSVNTVLLGDGSWSVRAFIHDQMVAADVWTISHNLGRFPSVAIVDTAGSVVIGQVVYVDDATVRVSFSAPFSGRAYLS